MCKLCRWRASCVDKLALDHRVFIQNLGSGPIGPITWLFQSTSLYDYSNSCLPFHLFHLIQPGVLRTSMIQVLCKKISCSFEGQSLIIPIQITVMADYGKARLDPIKDLTNRYKSSILMTYEVSWPSDHDKSMSQPRRFYSRWWNHQVWTQSKRWGELPPG